MDVKFNFPFKPYAIQEEFMKELYSTIEKKQLGIFESPTGTGKSLSICCGALQWLKDNNQKTLEALQNEISKLKEEISSGGSCDDWLQEEYEKIKKTQSLLSLQTKLENIKKQSEILNELKRRVAKQKANIVSKTEVFYAKDKSKKDSGDKENLLEPVATAENVEDGDLILEEVEDNNDDSDEEVVNDNQDEQDTIKIYITSRTHSQLSQFIGEIKRTVFKEDTRVVTLASRQHYCINTDVNRLKNVNLINERCLDLQKSKSKSTSVGNEGKILKKTKTKSCSACPYYNQANITKLKERLLVDILDMEDLVKCGKELKACPYYASRMALDDAEMVLVSHAGIVSAGARSGVSLKLQNNILILDEAHGLTAALENAHSAPVSLKQLTSVKTFLQFYVNKYRARLSSKNLLLLNQISFVVGKLLGMISPKPETKQAETTIYTVEDFVIKAEIDHMNLRPLAEFCRNTRLAPKLHGFSMRYSQQALEEEINISTVSKKSKFEAFLSNISKKKTEEVVVEKVEESKLKATNQPPTETSAGSGLYAIVELLSRLCERSANGRVLASSADSQLKYLLLNPSEHFAQVVNECRSVIVAGGTMEPIGEFKSLLTRDKTDESINVVRCEHVVPANNVLGICLSKGPTNVALNFSYENRKSNELLSEIGRILRNICSIVPGGVVCFLPSYSYEQTVYEHMKNNKVIETIAKKKTVFREPKSAAEVDQVLHKYALAVRNKTGDHTGALMLSVVGGKLSEGLNFSDDLGRCVVVIGMPYPNVKSPELQEKMNYLNRTEGGGAGNIYYENLCMKAVNQCIGRAVRHANDYACVLLVDDRYSRPQTVSALPSFVQKSLITNCGFGPTIGSIAKFFSRHKDKKLLE